MSNSRSPTPRHNTSPSNPSSSRPQLHDQPAPSTQHGGADRPDSLTQTRTRLPHSHFIEDPLSSASSNITQRRRRPASQEPSDDQTMSKRLRRSSPAPRQRDRESSSDSQGGMADTEEADGSHQSGRTPPPPNPQKKKRTRTLTTPHQSTVLHALLAQSRFPTTAMREEVGRSIGLSARKVQIWFQNQRQKARRPRAQGEVPLTRPPQYGPYPTVGESVPLGPAPGGSGQSSSSQYGQFARTAYPGQPSGYDYPSSLDPSYVSSVERSPQLLGPGMPGRVRYLSPSPQRSPIDDRLRPMSPRTRARPYPDPFVRRSASPPRRLSDPDFTFAGPSMIHHTTLGPGTSRPYVLRRTPSPSLTLPLPFPDTSLARSPLLPQWDAPRIAPLLAPPTAAELTLTPIRDYPDEPSTLPSISSRGTTDESPIARMERHAQDTPSPPLSRPAGRYDPVRATVIPFRRNPTPPPPASRS